MPSAMARAINFCRKHKYWGPNAILAMNEKATVIGFLSRAGYAPKEIAQITGLSSKTIWIVRHRLGGFKIADAGSRYCYKCELRYALYYNFCPRCGRQLPPVKTKRLLFDAHGAPM